MCTNKVIFLLSNRKSVVSREKRDVILYCGPIYLLIWMPTRINYLLSVDSVHIIFVAYIFYFTSAISLGPTNVGPIINRMTFNTGPCVLACRFQWKTASQSKSWLSNVMQHRCCSSNAVHDWNILAQMEAGDPNIHVKATNH